MRRQPPRGNECATSCHALGATGEDEISANEQQADILQKHPLRVFRLQWAGDDLDGH
jgi:hypothetical protein